MKMRDKETLCDNCKYYNPGIIMWLGLTLNDLVSCDLGPKRCYEYDLWEEENENE